MSQNGYRYGVTVHPGYYGDEEVFGNPVNLGDVVTLIGYDINEQEPKEFYVHTYVPPEEDDPEGFPQLLLCAVDHLLTLEEEENFYDRGISFHILPDDIWEYTHDIEVTAVGDVILFTDESEGLFAGKFKVTEIKPPKYRGNATRVTLVRI